MSSWRREPTRRKTIPSSRPASSGPSASAARKLIVIDPREIDLVKYADALAPPETGHGRRRPQRSDERHHHRGALTPRQYVEDRTEGFEALQSGRGEIHPELCREDLRRPGGGSEKGGPAVRQGEQGLHPLCHGDHPAHHRERTTSSPAPTWPCSAARSASKAAASTRSGARTTSRAPATWGRSPMSFPPTSRSPTTRRGRNSKRPGTRHSPAKPGKTIIEIMEGAHKGEIKALYIMGENPMISDPDLTHVEEALKHLELLVVQDIFLDGDGAAGRRGPALRLLRGKGRHLHQHGTPCPADPQGRPRSRDRRRRTGKSSPSSPPAWAIP